MSFNCLRIRCRRIIWDNDIKKQRISKANRLQLILGKIEVSIVLNIIWNLRVRNWILELAIEFRRVSIRYTWAGKLGIFWNYSKKLRSFDVFNARNLKTKLSLRILWVPCKRYKYIWNLPNVFDQRNLKIKIDFKPSWIII